MRSKFFKGWYNKSRPEDQKEPSISPRKRQLEQQEAVTKEMRKVLGVTSNETR